MNAFVTKRINWIQYLIPLIIESNSKNIKSILFINKNRKKFADPYEKKNFLILKKLSNQYNFIIKDIKDIINFEGKVYCIEGDIACSHRDGDNSFKFFNKNHYIITLRADFSMPIICDIYEKFVNEIIYINQHYCNNSNKKNKFLGSPKYNFIDFDKNLIFKKYNLDKTKQYILIFFPKKRSKTLNYPNKDKLLEIYDICKKNNYEILIKTRNQDKVKDMELKDKYYFEDGDFYPSISLELLSIAEIAICFSSSVIEECYYMKIPVINIKIDNYERLQFLTNNELYKELDISEINKLDDCIKTSKKNIELSNEIIKKYLYNKKTEFI